MAIGTHPSEAAGGADASFTMHRGETLTVLESSDRSNGERVVIRIDLEPGARVGGHAHPIEESFQCLSGRVEFSVEDRSSFVLNESEAITVAPGRLHGFHNASDRPASLRMIARPGTAAEFGLRLPFLLARDGFAVNPRQMPPRNLLLSAILLDRVGIYFPPLPRPLFRLLVGGLAALGRLRGRERFLIDRYAEYRRLLPAALPPRR